MSAELAAILSGLAAAFSWGAGDFAGGLASRRAAALRVALASQFIGTIALLAMGLVLREPFPSTSRLAYSAVAGLAGGIGLLLLYVSLARGKMGIAAPLTAVAAGGIPLVAGLMAEGLPDPYQMAGFVLALVAILIISGSERGESFRLFDIVLPLLAGVGFGVFMAILGSVGEAGSFVWPVIAARLASMSMFSLVLLSRRGPDSPGPIPWRLAAVAGIGDTAGNAFFVLSAASGRLDVAAVLGALYPATTALLARFVLDERLTARQSIGVVLALAAVILIAL